MKESPAKEKKAPAWPPFPEIATARCENEDHPHRYRFRWRTGGGRKRQWTISLVTPRDVAVVERLIRADAARDMKRPVSVTSGQGSKSKNQKP